MIPALTHKYSRVTYTITWVIWICVMVSVPFHKVLASPLLILSFLVLLTGGDYTAKWQRLRSEKSWWVYGSVYLLGVLGYILSESTTAALSDLNIKLYLVLIPLFMVIMRPMTDMEVKGLLQVFVYTCVVFMFTAWGIAAVTWFRTGENLWYYKYLVGFTYIHPSYIAMFMVFAQILTGADLLLKKRSIFQRKWMHYMFLALFALFILMLTAKIAIASMFIVLSILWILLAKDRLGLPRTIGLLVAGNIMLFLAMLALPYTRERMLMLLHYNSVTYTNSVNSREEIWKAGMQVALENTPFGTGTGDAQTALEAQYAQNGFSTGVEEHYNAHNAYLQVFIETGIPGLAGFLLFWIILLRGALKQKNYLHLAFLLLFMVDITTESMFKTQSGVVFFAFFNSLLGLHFRRD